MTIVNGYAEVTDLDEHLGDSKSRDSVMKERAIEAVSRGIDAYTGRRFWADDTPTNRRVCGYVTDRLYLPDFTDLTSITPEIAFNVLGDAYDSTQYRVGPDFAPVNGEPYNWVEAAWCWWSKTLFVTATWGWPSVPAAVVQACVMKAARVYKRRESITGVVGLDEFGPIRIGGREDADVIDLLTPYRFIPAA